MDSTPSTTPAFGRSEAVIVFLVGAVQFANILDFVMVMPLGDDLASALGFARSKVGYIGGSYTAAAALSGLAGSFFLDRFERRKALAVSMLGLVVGTALGGFAWNLPTLMAARVVAGTFGGPATSIALAIVADVIPPERRGRAMGKVMGAFSVASVVGVPLGLELARFGGWRLPFFSVAALGLLIAGLAVFLLPPIRVHLNCKEVSVTTRQLLRRPLVRLSYAATGVLMMAGFLLIPIFAPYLQQNLGYARDRMGLLYFFGGLASFGSMRAAGRLVDRFGSARVSAGACAALLALNYLWFVDYDPAVPVAALFVGFMIFMGFRNVAGSTLATKVPLAGERARFLSFQSTVQHLGFTAGAFVASRMLTEDTAGRLVGVSRVAFVSMGLTVLLPWLQWALERGVGRRAPE